MYIKELVSKLRAMAGIIHGSNVFGGPVQANLRLTNRCNIRCIHCHYQSPELEHPSFPPVRRAKRAGLELPSSDTLKSMMKSEAEPKQLMNVIDEFLDMGTRRFQIGGNGEPFLYKNIIEIIDRLKRSGSYCLANTNGTLITKEVAESLIRMKFDELRITTMAGTPEVYVRTHPGIPERMFYNLEKNLRYLSDQKNSLQVKMPEITLVTVVIAQNCDSLYEFAELAVRIGAQRVLFRPVDDTGEAGLLKTVPTGKQALHVGEQLKAIKPLLESNGIGHNIGYFIKIFHEQLNTEEVYRVIPCYYGWLATFVNPEGSVYPCCRCYTPHGNINEKSIREIWHGTSYKQFRKEALRINRSRKPVQGCDCYRCVHYAANFRIYNTLHPFNKVTVN